MKITIEFDSLEECLKYINCPAAVAPPRETAQEETPKAEEPVKEPAAEPIAEPEEDAISMQILRQALADLNEKTGKNAAKEIITQLGYTKFVDVPEADYPKLMKAVKDYAG
jgi:hypothetical protein